MITFEYIVQGRHVEDLEAQARDVLSTLVPKERQNGFDMSVEPQASFGDGVPVVWVGRVTGWVKEIDG